MTDKVAINLRNVQETLLLPLWGRAVESRKPKPLLIDAAASAIIEKIQYDFSTIAANIGSITQLAWIARSIHTDRTVKDFLRRHPAGTIVNVGCGLDTTFERVDNGTVRWYDLDMPEVIALRKQFITDSERRSSLSRSFLEDSWCSDVSVGDSILFIAAGVFYYFEEQEMKRALIRLAELYPGGEVFFDYASPLGMRTANKVVIQAGGMDQNSFLKWGIERARELEAWDSRIHVVKEFPMFKGIKRHLGPKAMFGTFMSDRLRIMSMVHLRFTK